MADPGVAEKAYPWADRFVLGYPLPSWQREFKWSIEQSEKFIDSIWRGVALGSYTRVEYELLSGIAHVEHLPFSNSIMDGQQRLKSLEMYFDGLVKCPNVEGVPTLWSEVSLVDRRRFGKTVFNCATIPLAPEQSLREYYDLMNFGGVAHTDAERATSVESRVDSPRP